MPCRVAHACTHAFMMVLALPSVAHHNIASVHDFHWKAHLLALGSEEACTPELSVPSNEILVRVVHKASCVQQAQALESLG